MNEIRRKVKASLFFNYLLLCFKCRTLLPYYYRFENKLPKGLTGNKLIMYIEESHRIF